MRNGIIRSSQTIAQIERLIPDGSLAQAIADALAFCLKEAPETVESFERGDRLPLARARREASVRRDGAPDQFLIHVFESWIIAQHAYWAVGRGLADARGRGRVLLRLRIGLEETGWTLLPGANRGSHPIPTADRLGTAMSLARESGLLASGSAPS